MKRAAIGIALFLVSRVAFADDARLTEARKAHDALDFERCVAILAQPPPPESTDLDRGDAEVLEGVCIFELSDTRRAGEHFRSGLRIHPRALLPSNSSPKIVEAFATAQADVRAEQSTPPQPPPPPPPVARRTETTHHAPPLLSYVLAGGAVVAGAIGTVGYTRGRGLESDANSAHFESDAYANGDQARSSMVIANVGFASALVLAAAAVVVWLRAD